MSIVNRIVSVAWQRLSKCFKKHMRTDKWAGGRDELSRIRFCEHRGGLACQLVTIPAPFVHGRDESLQQPETSRLQAALAQFDLAWASQPPYVSHRGLPLLLLVMTRTLAHGIDRTWAEGR